MLELLRGAHLQAKLAVESAADPQEQEADRIADRVVSSSPSSAVQREPAGGNATGRTGQCEQCRKDGLPASSGGQLSMATRTFFEARFGFDFGGVRVHNDAAAHRFTGAIRAKAATVGRNIYFAPGRFSPETGDGRRLLAHELAHVVQQSRSAHVGQRVQRKEGDPFPAKGIQVIGAGAKDLATILADCTGIPLTIGSDNLLRPDSSRKRSAGASNAATAQLDLMLKDTTTGIIVDTDPAAEGVDVGAFSHSYPGYQRIDVANLLVYAKSSGEKKGLTPCDAALHEITEAFTARKASIKDPKHDPFVASHEAGFKVETAIRKDLGRPARSRKEGSGQLLGKENEKTLLWLDSQLFGEGKDVYSQISVVRFVLGSKTKGSGGKTTQSGDYNVVASHVVKGEVTFDTQLAALEVFNKYAADLGFTPIKIPESLKKQK